MLINRIRTIKGNYMPAIEGENGRLSTATSFSPPKTGRNIL